MFSYFLFGIRKLPNEVLMSSQVVNDEEGNDLQFSKLQLSLIKFVIIQTRDLDFEDGGVRINYV